jgi:hypothetical protein
MFQYCIHVTKLTPWSTAKLQKLSVAHMATIFVNVLLKCEDSLPGKKTPKNVVRNIVTDT